MAFCRRTLLIGAGTAVHFCKLFSGKVFLARNGKRKEFELVVAAHGALFFWQEQFAKCRRCRSLSLLDLLQVTVTDRCRNCCTFCVSFFGGREKALKLLVTAREV